MLTLRIIKELMPSKLNMLVIREFPTRFFSSGNQIKFEKRTK